MQNDRLYLQIPPAAAELERTEVWVRDEDYEHIQLLAQMLLTNDAAAGRLRAEIEDILARQAEPADELPSQTTRH
ncbi:hypothetical protein [Geminicoccus roseus]|uniref:hypothetical protein n=1 Tax=Geminicoccus roseus TaxID=404900 RepID=UPI000417BDFE|nr:hypothetical protein [Geminicoccus roseus]